MTNARRRSALVAVLLAWSPGAHADEPPSVPKEAVPANGEKDAQQDYERGAQHYSAGEYAEAARFFRAAHEKSKLPAVLYNVAQAERLGGDCVSALRDYEEFARITPEAAPADLSQKVAEMKRCAEASPPTKPTPRPAPLPRAPRARPRATVRHNADVRGPLAYSTLVGSLTAASLGTFYTVRTATARQRLEDANSAGSQWTATLASDERSWERSRNAAIGFFAASGVLAATTVWLFATKKTDTTGSPSVSGGIMLDPNCAVARVSSAF